MIHYDVAPIAGFDPEIGLLLAALEDSTREWQENLEEPSVEAICWQPAPDFHSIGAIFLHMADCEAYWFEEVAAKLERTPEELQQLLVNETDQDNVKWPTPPAEPIEWYFDLHRRIRARSIQAIKNIASDQSFQGTRASYTLRWIVAHVVEHDAYHGGQAVLLYELWKLR
ncbi:MAG: DinB family protein [Fimbriimonadaceae bacterium]